MGCDRMGYVGFCVGRNISLSALAQLLILTNLEDLHLGRISSDHLPEDDFRVETHLGPLPVS